MDHRLHTYLLVVLLSVIGCRPAAHVTGLRADNEDIQVEQKDLGLDALIAPYRAELTENMDVLLCQNAYDMTRARPESALGNCVSDLCLRVARDTFPTAIDAALLNYGGLRATLAAGPVTVGDIYQLLPFDNELVVVELPYQEVVNMIEYLRVTGGEPVSDMRIVFDENGTKEVIINGSPLEERSYAFLTNDYLSNGGDNMIFLTEGRRTSRTMIGVKVRDAFLIMCEKLGKEGSTLAWELDGRITKE